MLKEYAKVRQERGSVRRLFSDDQYDLYVWYEADGLTIVGFQIVYFRGEEQKAFTWVRESGFSHTTVEGWDDSRFNRTPFLVADGVVDIDSLRSEFDSRGTGIDEPVRSFVSGKLAEYGVGRL